MAFPIEVLEEIEVGTQYLSNLNQDIKENFLLGCNCVSETYSTLERVIIALDGKIELDEYDQSAIDNVELMNYVVGDYTLQIPPTVDAGANKTVGIDDTATFTATIVEGSSPIVSILWTIHPTATLTDANEETVTIEDFQLGNSVVTVKVTAENGLVARDSAILTGVEASTVVNFGWSVTDPFGSENVPTLQQSQAVIDGATEYTLPFQEGANLNYLIVNEPSSFPEKDFYINVAEVTEGNIPDSRMREGVVIGSRRYYASRVPFAFDPNSMDLTLKQV